MIIPRERVTILTFFCSIFIHRRNTREKRSDQFPIDFYIFRIANRRNGQSCSINYFLESLNFLIQLPSLFSRCGERSHLTSMSSSPVEQQSPLTRYCSIQFDSKIDFTIIFDGFRSIKLCSLFSVCQLPIQLLIHLSARSPAAFVWRNVFLFDWHLLSFSTAILMKIWRCPSLFDRIEQLVHIRCDAKSTNWQK